MRYINKIDIDIDIDSIFPKTEGQPLLFHGCLSVSKCVLDPIEVQAMRPLYIQKLQHLQTRMTTETNIKQIDLSQLWLNHHLTISNEATQA